jgi:hypothetical protein
MLSAAYLELGKWRQFGETWRSLIVAWGGTMEQSCRTSTYRINDIQTKLVVFQLFDIHSRI